jgi:transposase
MKKQHVKLTKEDYEKLEEIVNKGKKPARVYKRAIGLLEMEKGKTLQEIAQTLEVKYITVAGWRDKYRKEGLGFLEDKKRPGRPIEIDELQKNKIKALASSPVPEGRKKWDLRLLAKKVVELGYCKEISHTQVGRILKNS